MKALLGTFFLKIRNFFNSCISTSQKQNFYTKGSIIHPTFRLGPNNFISINKSAIINIAEDTTLNQANYLTIHKGAKFSLGKGTYITRATISCLGEISIGENCILGEGMKLFDHNHQYTKLPFSVSKTDFNIGKITMGNNVWTGANVVILKDVTIGDNVIIGAGCVIHKDVPANSIIINKQEQKLIDL